MSKKVGGMDYTDTLHQLPGQTVSGIWSVKGPPTASQPTSSVMEIISTKIER